MNALTITNHNGADVIDSRQVAEMVGKQHKNLLRDITGYLDTMQKSTGLKIEPSDFFIDSTYKDATGRELPCYLLTKKGCDMVANKMTGEKGVLFTAAYVTAFEAMREHIETGKPLPKSHKTDQELAAADKRATAMQLNAKTRVANQLMTLWNKAGVKPEYQALALGDLYTDDGIHLPRIALQGAKVTYDKGTIAKMLGVYSRSGKPHALAIGGVISKLDVVPDEMETVPFHRNGHDGTDCQYTESVIEKVKNWLQLNNYPSTILMQNGKDAYVRYGDQS